jgi:hypothetical protein
MKKLFVLILALMCFACSTPQERFAVVSEIGEVKYRTESRKYFVMESFIVKNGNDMFFVVVDSDADIIKIKKLDLE